MRTRSKALLFTAAMAVGSGAYGTIRFHAARYSPQCDHLPGVCVYGSENPDSAAVRTQAGEAGSVIRTLDLCFGNRCSSATATYENPEARVPKTVGLGQLDRQICGVSGPVQIVVSPRRTLVARGCWGGVNFPRDVDHFKRQLGDFIHPRDPERYLAPYMGLKEIFRAPSILTLPCRDSPQPESPQLCRDRAHPQAAGGGPLSQAEELACGTERNLAALAQGAQGFQRCALQQERRELIQAIEQSGPATGEGRLRERSSIANIAVGDAERAGQHEAGSFWRGWDVLFLAAFAGGLIYGIRKTYLAAAGLAKRAANRIRGRPGEHEQD
ncbi:MAG TPA: hypothetical protein VLD37_02120 [Candidatus Bilamarchaeum sp.]|nr:hypothetical protein [Candidatus Bilamarchaeum sp.]